MASPARYPGLKAEYLELNASLRLLAMAQIPWSRWSNIGWISGTFNTENGRRVDYHGDLFIADRLHLNDEGYEVWVRELRRQGWLAALVGPRPTLNACLQNNKNLDAEGYDNCFTTPANHSASLYES